MTGHGYWWLVGVAAVLVGVVLLSIAALQSEWAERRLEDWLSGRLDRPVALDDIGVVLAWPPRLHVGAIRIANPDWAQNEQLLQARDVALSVDVLPLLIGRVVLDRVAVGKAAVALERKDGKETWHFARDANAKSDEAANVKVKQARIGSADIRYRDTAASTQLDFHVQGTAGNGGGMTFEAHGSYRGESVDAHARTPVLALSADQAIAFSVAGTIGAVDAKAHGKLVASSTAAPSADFSVSLSAPDLSALNNILPVDMPRSPPFHLAGDLSYTQARWQSKHFAGRMGDSDLHGSFSYVAHKSRPFVRADLHSNVLDLDDLGPLLGAPPATGGGETASPRQRQEAREREAAGKLLPSLPLGARGWKSVDTDIHYVAERIVSAPPAALESLETRAVMQAGRLRLDPLVIGVAGGQVKGTATLDAAQPPLQATLQAEAASVQLARLFPQVRSSNAALGTLYGKARLRGRGDSIASLLGTSDGEITAAIDGGSVNALLVEAIGLDAAEALVLLGTKRREQVPLNCAVADFAVEDGTAGAKTFVVDTRDTRIAVRGSIDLKSETLHLVANPAPRDASPVSARGPIVIEGTLRHPDVHPGGKAFARAGTAILLATINPLLALIPLFQPPQEAPNNCAALLEEARAAR